jgi:Acetyltransferases, including N-acetylases of ribosomal proteins
VNIKLRAVELEDKDLIYEWENLFELWEVSSTTRPFSHFAIETYVRSCQDADIYSEGQIRLMIDMQEQDKTFTVGCVDLFNIDAQHLRAEVGLFIASEYRGRHIAKQTMEQLFSYATHILNLNQIYAFIPQDNAWCIKLFENLGYKYSATLQQWIKRGKTYLNVLVYQKIV